MRGDQCMFSGSGDCISFFFFQAEDGIRDHCVTGVQTCALPISSFPVEDGDATILELRVAPADLGKVIGRQGRTAKSIRTLLGAASMKFKKRYMLEDRKSVV